MSESPFVPGARVAIRDRYGDGRTEAFVEKVHTNGNFTLRGSKQQWRPWRSGYDGRWSAHETGGGYGRRALDIWDETTDATTDAEIAAAVAKTRRRTRLREIQERVRRLQVNSTTDAMLDAIEAALPKQEPKP